ncbi:hypothetical protein ATCC90586_004213 [Pythium insidiosum]|nr:hypothetical protein ATCC90586_004213 [Pythium insidiosum]
MLLKSLLVGVVVVVTTSTFVAAQGHLVLPNWVGPKVGRPSDTACYRKTIRSKHCPTGYEFDKVATCWAQCPLEYPVECGMECIPQNEDCGLEVIKKISVVANAAINLASTGVSSQIIKASQGVAQGIKCGQQLFGVSQKIVGYANELREKFPNTTQDQLSYLMSKSDLVVYDLPIAVATCLGRPAPAGLSQAADIIKIVKSIIQKIIEKGPSVLAPKTFLVFTSEVGLDASVKTLNPTEMSQLEQLLSSDATCGKELKSIVDRLVDAVKEAKTRDPSATADVLRVAISKSELFQRDLPLATTACITTNAPEGYRTRDEIRKTMQVVIDRIIDTASASGKPVPLETYILSIADMGLGAIAMFDPTGLAALAKEFVQPICGPTSILGEIDDGPAALALGLRTISRAFEGSYGNWTNAGDGVVRITFKSSDVFDVDVNVMSAGDKIASVRVKKGQSVVWTKPVAELQDKTLYLDRWRPGFLGIPGTGGGSLLLWIPHAANGGHLDLVAQLNMQTSYEAWAKYDVEKELSRVEEREREEEQRKSEARKVQEKRHVEASISLDAEQSAELSDAKACYERALESVRQLNSLIPELEEAERQADVTKDLAGVVRHFHQECHMGIGACESRLRRYAAASEAFKEVLLKDEKHLLAWLERGRAFEKMHAPLLALLHYTRVTSSDPNFRDAKACEDRIKTSLLSGHEDSTDNTISGNKPAQELLEEVFLLLEEANIIFIEAFFDYAMKKYERALRHLETLS